MLADLTLLIPYRRRQASLLSLLKYLEINSFPQDWPELQILLLEGDQSPSISIQSLAQHLGLEYQFLDVGATFHKTRLLNYGLSLVKTAYVAAYDVDLIPLHLTVLRRHLWLAGASPALLITGYRLMLSIESWPGYPALTELATSAQIAPEDQPSALCKHLVANERFGVLPLFATERLQKIGGWDETFLGWGAEDQDVIERYLGNDLCLCRVPELVYLHLAHPYPPDWYSSEGVERNRRYYYSKRGE